MSGFIEGQRALRPVIAELRQIDDDLEILAPSLPELLRGIVECVRHDLLEDALKTLDGAANQNAEALRARLGVES
jgi:hypothetical protein